MDGLSSIRPEIQAFVSRENRSHADPWLQQVDWVEHERTLTLYVQRPVTGIKDKHFYTLRFQYTGCIQYKEHKYDELLLLCHGVVVVDCL